MRIGAIVLILSYLVITATAALAQTPYHAWSQSFGDANLDRSIAMDVDGYGNLYVTSGVAVRQVTAGADGVAGPVDEVITLYGSLPRDTFPANITSCLTGVAVAPEGDSVMTVDECQGVAIRIQNVTNP